MILIDTSVWVDHLRYGDPAMAAALKNGRVLMHAFVLGELACGNIVDRVEKLGLLGDLPVVPTATDHQVLDMIERYALMRRGVGYIDVHLLTSTALAGNVRMWTRDKKLAVAASELGLLAVEEEGVS